MFNKLRAELLKKEAPKYSLTNWRKWVDCMTKATSLDSHPTALSSQEEWEAECFVAIFDSLSIMIGMATSTWLSEKYGNEVITLQDIPTDCSASAYIYIYTAVYDHLAQLGVRGNAFADQMKYLKDGIEAVEYLKSKYMDIQDLFYDGETCARCLTPDFLTILNGSHPIKDIEFVMRNYCKLDISTFKVEAKYAEAFALSVPEKTEIPKELVLKTWDESVDKINRQRMNWITKAKAKQKELGLTDAEVKKSKPKR